MAAQSWDGLAAALPFPDGRLPSRRWRPVFWLDVACSGTIVLANALHAGALEANGQVVNPLGIAGAGPLLNTVVNGAQTVFLVVVLVAIVSVIVRYRRAAGAQRQQIKWFAYGAALIGLIFTAAVSLASALTPSGQDPSNSLVSTVGFSLGFLMLPLGAGVGVLRYRLYAVDILINRTLVYGALSVSLAAVYFASVLGMQHLAAALASPQASQNLLIIVLSTLLIAALFTPFRRRIQLIIDRRFYRRKYDAAKTLERFAATLRNEIELSALRQHVPAVVRETMQPEHLSLWLRQPKPSGEART